MCQLVACYLLWCRTLGLLHRFCQWCILSHWLGSHISHILSDRCECISMAFDIRHRRFGPRTHSGSPVWWTHVTCCTAVNQHELSAGANPGQQIPQTSNACQWCNSSIRRFQLSLFADTVHFAIALAATIALGLFFARSLAVGRPSIGCSLAVPAIARVVSRLAAHLASLASFVVA